MNSIGKGFTFWRDHQRVMRASYYSNEGGPELIFWLDESGKWRPATEQSKYATRAMFTALDAMWQLVKNEAAAQQH